ncbi:alpha-L-rhamnosidase [Microbacterium hydrocarbonoxydans]|uniref:alpha-L-rhamnosidase n=1 Tax=Microbacterium hydrocarbonoxydans TaxID=273678 RepID=UPI0020425E95|nr:alpha-L-rhamnosidase [Microbacterium hydrocarbonoxydans]MCM3779726.1 glycoside hydrolase family 78 protein [Microbacterium hydrocarbonoxydans]
MRPVRVTGVRIGRRRDAAVASSPTPPVSWTVEAPSDWRAQAAALRLDGGTEHRIGPDPVLRPWPFAPLTAGHGAEHRLEVRVQGEDGAWSEWSEPLRFSEAFLVGGWSAPLLRHPSPGGPAAPLFLRREVRLPSDVVGATLVTTAQGVHRVFVNGVEVDDHVLKPGWTSYRDRLAATVTDVTTLLTGGAAAVIAVEAAGGWFTERYGFGPNAARFYGDQAGVSVRLLLRHADGRSSEIDSSEWTVDPDPPLVASGLYAGEDWDARREKAGWMRVGFDDSAWLPAQLGAFPADVAVEVIDVEPVRRTAHVTPVSVQQDPHGDTAVVDFGQNLVGRLRLWIDAADGAAVTLRHAEILQDGALATRALRAATATDRFIGDGSGRREVEPAFAVHGFRYAEISGLSGPLAAGDVRAVVLGSDVRRTGWFTSSDPMLNRLHENVVWSLRGNLLSVPTDCPQRDERLGWTGDAQVFAPAAASLFDVDAFFGAWLDDLALEQRRSDGVVPTVVPDPLGAFSAVAAAGWGDAVTTVPALLAERYGDADLRRRLAPAMRDWVDACERLATTDGLWESGFQYGDWLDPTATRPDKAKTDAGLVAGAYRVRSARLAGQALRVAGDDVGAAEADRIAARATAAFQAAYLTPSGRLMSDAPTAYALVLAFHLAPPELRPALGIRLAFLLRAGGYRLATGFLGTPLVLDALLDSGQELAAERLLFQTVCPSWLYPVTMGATTVWERPDAVRPDGTLHPSGMVSLNHCAFGAVADVLHRRIGGLASSEPGYRRMRISLWIPSVLDHAEVVQETPLGRARVRWERGGDGIRVSAEVPPGARADVLLRDRPTFDVGAGRHEWLVQAPPRPPSDIGSGVDADLAALADAPGVCGLVSRILADHSPEISAEFEAYIRWVPGRSLRPELIAVSAPPELIERVDAALRGIADGRSSKRIP